MSSSNSVTRAAGEAALRAGIQAVAYIRFGQDSANCSLEEIGTMVRELDGRLSKAEHRLQLRDEEQAAAVEAATAAHRAEVAELRRKLAELEQTSADAYREAHRNLRALAEDREQLMAHDAAREAAHQSLASDAAIALLPFLSRPGATLRTFGEPAYQHAKDVYAALGGDCASIPPPPRPGEPEDD